MLAISTVDILIITITAITCVELPLCIIAAYKFHAAYRHNLAHSIEYSPSVYTEFFWRGVTAGVLVVLITSISVLGIAAMFIAIA